MSTSSISEMIDLAEDFEIREQVQADLLRRITEAPIDSRAALSDYVPVADEHQYKVIHAEEQTVRLVAPAGSGKTQTVVNRVLHLVKHGMHPDRILVLTFDTSAAKALRDKMSEQTQAMGTSLRNFQVSTLNAFGYGVLREYFPTEFKPIVGKNQTRGMIYLMKRDLAKAGRDQAELLPSHVRDRVYFEFFSLLKNELIDPRNVDSQKFADFVCSAPQAEPFLLNALPLGMARPGTQLTPGQIANLRSVIQVLLWMYKDYDGRLRALNVIDFDDQKLRAHMSLQSHQSLLEGVQRRFHEVIVDEFQDINRLEFAFIKSISERSRLIVVGDDDQAIYGFRGCSPEYIIHLENHLTRQHCSYELRKNYRCPPNIVDYATRLIRFNRNRIDKNPIAHSDVPAHISVESTATAGLEARSVVAYMMQVRSRNEKLGFEKFAVLYRTNAQSLPLQIEFILNDIPYWVREEDNVLENDSLNKFLAVLRVRLARREGHNANARDCALLVGSYLRYVSDSQLDKLEKLFQGNGNFDSVLRSEAFHQLLPKASNSRCREVVLGLLRLGGRLSRVINYLATEFQGFAGMVGSLEDVVDNRVPLGEIFDLAANHKGSEKDFLMTMESALHRARQGHAGRAENDGVALLTYFKAKGRQWHTVMLTTCNQGLIPHRKAPIEDERRLFYVAMTRASANLMISYVAKSCNNKVKPSQFLSEAGFITSP
jgi:DNA helicase II / ATP-dependent DNA helicase PcrA